MTAAAEDVRDLRVRIRDEATRLFAQRGFAGTAVRELVAACACTKPALYYHYENKETLYRDVVEYHLEHMRAVLQRTINSTGSARKRLHDSIHELLDYAEANPLAMQLLHRLESSPEEMAPAIDMSAARDLHFSLLAEIVAQGIASSELRSDVEPLDCAMAIVGVVHFQCEKPSNLTAADRDRIHRTIDLIFDGIAQ